MPNEPPSLLIPPSLEVMLFTGLHSNLQPTVWHPTDPKEPQQSYLHRYYGHDIYLFTCCSSVLAKASDSNCRAAAASSTRYFSHSFSSAKKEGQTKHIWGQLLWRVESFHIGGAEGWCLVEHTAGSKIVVINNCLSTHICLNLHMLHILALETSFKKGPSTTPH